MDSAIAALFVTVGTMLVYDAYQSIKRFDAVEFLSNAVYPGHMFTGNFSYHRDLDNESSGSDFSDESVAAEAEVEAAAEAEVEAAAEAEVAAEAEAALKESTDEICAQMRALVLIEPVPVSPSNLVLLDDTAAQAQSIGASMADWVDLS